MAWIAAMFANDIINQIVTGIRADVLYTHRTGTGSIIYYKP
jgi:hypothetical protein